MSRSPEHKSGRSRSRSRSPRRRRSRSRSRSRGSRSPRSRSRSRSPERKKDSERMTLDTEAVAYVLGRGGSTKRRLEQFTRATLEVDDDTVDIIGSSKQIEVAKLCIQITLEQRKGFKKKLNYDKLEERDDCEIMWVPSNCIGYILGAKGSTMRNLEERCRTFMFFDNDRIKDNKKCLYILGEEKCRDKGRKEIEDVVEFKLKKAGDPNSGGSNVNCYNCNKPGHISRNCPERRDSYGGSSRYRRRSRSRSPPRRDYRRRNDSYRRDDYNDRRDDRGYRGRDRSRSRDRPRDRRDDRRRY